MLEVDRQGENRTRPFESYVCFGRETREACESFIYQWDKFENEGKPIDLSDVKFACDSLYLKVSGMIRNYRCYLKSFTFSPTPLFLSEDEKEQTAPCVEESKE